jgi:hypothetical protein
MTDSGGTVAIARPAAFPQMVTWPLSGTSTESMLNHITMEIYHRTLKVTGGWRIRTGAGWEMSKTQQDDKTRLRDRKQMMTRKSEGYIWFEARRPHVCNL